MTGTADLALGVLNLTADNSQLTGAAVTEAGAIANVTLENGAGWNATGASNPTEPRSTTAPST